MSTPIDEREKSDAKPTWMTEGTASRHSHMHGYSSDQSEQKKPAPITELNQKTNVLTTVDVD